MMKTVAEALLWYKVGRCDDIRNLAFTPWSQGLQSIMDATDTPICNSAPLMVTTEAMLTPGHWLNLPRKEDR